MDSCSETIQQKLSQALGNLEKQSLEPQLSGLEQFERIQQQSEHLLMSLDSSLRTVFRPRARFIKAITIRSPKV
ncbi:MAG: hypothetical protein HC784_07490 [Hydrococcus sp. CSU_1_8]|nr:hypothetical protein [Hydrococcus sp. CSU_1_8]